MSASTVVGAFDPRHDREAQLVEAGAAAQVQDVLLQQGEEHSMAALSPAAPTRTQRPDHAVHTDRLREATRPELRVTVGMDPAPGHLEASSNGHLQRVYHEPRGHAPIGSALAR